MVKKLVNKCHIQKKITPHSFRRSYATKLIDNGLKIMVVKKLLGRNDIRKIQRYIIVNEKDLHKAVNPLTPFYESKNNTGDVDIKQDT